MKSEIMRIQQELDITVIFVTHDQDEALDHVPTGSRSSTRAGWCRSPTAKASTTAPRTASSASFVGESNMFPCRVDKPATASARVTIADATRGQARLSGQAKGDPGLAFRPA